jgi:biopolymer transport protein ExbB/biopolymer transport protein TolQ
MQWDFLSMWEAMSPMAKSVVIVLFLMFGAAVIVMIDRALRYRLARRHTIDFVRQVEPALREGDLNQVISIAERNPKSPIAQVVANGLTEFRSAHSSVPDDELMDVTQRCLQRTSAIVHSELKRGLSGLATIGSTAPFVGLFGTVLGIINAFRGTLEPEKGLGGVAGGISEALVTTALGLSVAVAAVWCYNYFTTTTEGFDIEMENSSLELMNYLTLRVRQRAR